MKIIKKENVASVIEKLKDSDYRLVSNRDGTFLLSMNKADAKKLVEELDEKKAKALNQSEKTESLELQKNHAKDYTLNKEKEIYHDELGAEETIDINDVDIADEMCE